MAVREIKTTLAVDGERAFNKAVTEAGRNMRVMASEMKSAAADFNLTGDEMEYLGRKSKSLNSQIAQQEAIIKALEGAVADSAKAYGDASAKTDGYRIKLNNANASLSKLRKELEDNDRQMMELGRDAQRAGRQLEQGLGEAAEDTARKFDKMVNELDKDIIDIKGAVEFSALADIGGMLSSGVDVVVNAVSGLTEGTLDYRRQMAFLEQNATDMGFDPDWLKQQAAGIAALTGDMDGAVEAVSNMARVAPDVDSFTRVMNRLLGATIAWPDTFKIENLAESLQESLASGSITGAYSELMSRLGLDIETINKSFEEAAKKGSDALWTAGTAWTSEHGFEETLKQYKEMNKELLAYNEAKIKLTEAEATLADKLTPAATAGIEMFTGMIDGMTDLITKYEQWNANFQKENEKTKKMIEETIKEAQKFTSAEEFTEAIAEADAAGEYAKAQVLVAEREKFLKAEAQRRMAELEQQAENEAKTTLEEIFSEENMAQTQTDADTAGQNISTSIGNGIATGKAYAVNQAAQLFQGIEAELNKTIQGPTVYTPGVGSGATNYGGQGYGGNAGSTYGAASINLDGKKVGEGMVDYNSSATGKKVERASTYLYGGG